MTSHPGETLRDILRMERMTQKELARRMQRPLKTVCEIVCGKASITARTAIQLERVFGVSAEFWMARQANYDIAAAKKGGK